MISVDDAKKVLNRFSIDRRTYVELKDSFGRVLAEDIVSGIDVPSFDRSDMDGYAIRDRDLDDRRFKLVGEMHAGGDLEVAIGGGVSALMLQPVRISRMGQISLFRSRIRKRSAMT